MKLNRVYRFTLHFDIIGFVYITKQDVERYQWCTTQ